MPIHFMRFFLAFLAMTCAFTFILALSFALAKLASAFALVRLAFALVVLIAKDSTRPTAKYSDPFSPSVIFAIERLCLILRRERANYLLLMRWCWGFHLSCSCCLLQPRQLLLGTFELVAQLPLFVSLPLQLVLQLLLLCRSARPYPTLAAAHSSVLTDSCSFRADQSTSISHDHLTQPVPRPGLPHYW